MGLLGRLARPLTPKAGAKAIVFLGRDNGLPWNAALDARVGSNLEVAAIANHVCSTPNNRHLRLKRTLPFRAISDERGDLHPISAPAKLE